MGRSERFLRLSLVLILVVLASAVLRAEIISGSASHVLTVQSGQVCGAGENRAGQLGDGTFIDHTRTVFAAASKNIVGVSTNENHSLAVASDGSAWAWGNNQYGRLGDGTSISKPTPIRIPELSSVVAVAAGQYHSIALKDDGSVWAWGYNGNGQVGDGTFGTRTRPVRVIGLEEVVGIAAGNEFSLALKRDGTVWSWGQNSSGQLGEGTNTRRTSPVQVSNLTGVSQIAAGGDHALAISKSDGSVWAWGANVYGQIGNGVTREQTTPTRSGTLTGAVSVSAGLNFSVVARTDGTVWAWGRNNAGQLGDRTITTRSMPVQALGVTQAKLVTAGASFTLVERTDGSRLGWGANTNGQLGNGTTNDSNTPIAWSPCTSAILPGAWPPESLPSGRITLSNSHALTVQSERLCGTGENDFSQLGDGTVVDRWKGVYTAGLRGPVSIATNARHSLAVTADGSVWAWGANPYGQLGDGSTNSKAVPVQVKNIDGAIAVAAGQYHSLALRSDGSVWAWGYNGNGQIGDGTTANRSLPVRVLDVSNVIAIAAGNEFNLALKSDGTVWSWGQNSSGQLGDGTYTRKASPVIVADLDDVFAIAAGGDHSLAIRRTDGSVWSWGYGVYGQLGSGNTNEQPRLVRAGSLTGAIAIAGGASFSLAARSDGTVWSWGRNGSGQLGDRSTTTRLTPVQVSGLSDVRAVSAGDAFAAAERHDGSRSIWGDNARGQFGNGNTNGSTVPVAWAGCPDAVIPPVTSRFEVKVLSASFDHGLVLRHDRSVAAAGSNEAGQLGTGSTSVALLAQVPGLPAIRSISTNESHTLAVAGDGTVWAWGTNTYGRLGDGTTVAKQAPFKLQSISDVIAVAAGRYHSLALKSDGTVWAWGYNGNGQLGDGSAANKLSPVQVISLSGVAAIAAGEEHSLALKSDGTVWAWGANGSGQLGNGTYTRSTFPVQVAGLDGVLLIAAGASHSMAVRRADGSVWTWGLGANGQLGDGANRERPNIVRAGDLIGIVAIAGGTAFSLAVSSDGSVWSWGLNRDGQLGDGSTESRNVPVRVRSLSTVVDVAGGARHSWALLTDGRLFAWGANESGQFGIATPPRSTVPVEVGGGLVACDCLNSAAPPVTPPIRVSSVRPNSVVAGSSDVLLVVTGEGFSAESVVQWNQTRLATTFINSTELRATVGRQFLANPVTAVISVATLGTPSNSAGFLVTSPAKASPLVAAKVEPQRLSYPAPSGPITDDAQEDLFRITNNGDEPLRYLVEVEKGAAWLSLTDAAKVSISKVEGALPPRTEAKVAVRTSFNRLTRPQEDGIIAVSYGPELQFQTKINVQAGSLNKPDILLSRTAIQFFATKTTLDRGDTLAVPIHILNLGTAPLQWEAVSSKTRWLSVNPSISPSPSGLPAVTGSSGSFPVHDAAVLVNLEELRKTETLNPATGVPQGPLYGSIVVRDLNRTDVISKRIEVTVNITETAQQAVVYPTGFLFTGNIGEDLREQKLRVESTAGKLVQFKLLASPLWETLFGNTCTTPDCITDLPVRRSEEFTVKANNLPANHPEVVNPVAASLTVDFNVQGATSIPASQGGNWRIEGLVVRRSTAAGAATQSKGTRQATLDCENTLHVVSASLPQAFFATRTNLQRVELRIANGCGALLDSGVVTATPSNGDPVIHFRPTGTGGWEGSWQPGGAPGDVRLVIRATAPNGAEARRSIEGQVVANPDAAPTTPIIVNAASFQHESVVTPGAILSVIGTDFLTGDGPFSAEANQAATMVGTTSVWLGESRLPILSAMRIPSSGGGTPIDQINVAVPFDIPVAGHLLLVVERNDRRSNPAEVMVGEVRPGIFGAGDFALAFDQNSQLLTVANRAERGSSIRIHATGLGRVTSPPAAGMPGLTDPLSHVVGDVKVFFNGIQQSPSFAGLSPGQTGVYQVNVPIPESVTPNNGAVDLWIVVDGVRSNVVSLPVL